MELAADADELEVTSVTGPVEVNNVDRWKVAYDTINLAEHASNGTINVYRLLADETVTEGLLKNPDNDLVPDASYIHQNYEDGNYVHLFEVEVDEEYVYYILSYEIATDSKDNKTITVGGATYSTNGEAIE